MSARLRLGLSEGKPMKMMRLCIITSWGCIHMNVGGEKIHVRSPTWKFCIHIKSAESMLIQKSHFTYERGICVFINSTFTLLRGVYSYERTWRKNPRQQSNVAFLYLYQQARIHVEQKTHFTYERGICVFINSTFTLLRGFLVENTT